MLNEKMLTQCWLILLLSEGRRPEQSVAAKYTKANLLYPHLPTGGIHLALRNFFALHQTKAIRLRKSLGNIQCMKLQQASTF